MPPIIAIAIGGAVGAVSRYLVGLASLYWFGDRFAFGTLIVNVMGCFVLGILLQHQLVATAKLPTLAHAGLTVGFLGALTTFSTFGVETIRFVERGEWWLAAINVGANVTLGLLAAAAGHHLARRLPEWIGVA